MRRKDPSIPREWFHLPAGAEPPSVDQLLRDSSPETDYPTTRAKSPPICGRTRSKSRERKPFKSQRDKDDGGYEPVGLGRDSHQGSTNAKAIPPRKAITALPSPPVINRSNKPKLVSEANNKDDNAGGGYEPVGRALLSPDQLPYASVRPDVKDQKKDKKEAEKSKKELEKAKKEAEKAEKERKQQEKIEREKLEKERKQLEKAEAKRKAEERKAEAEELKRQKEAKKQAEKAEAEAKKKAEAEVKKKAEAEAKLLAEKESKLKAEEAARVKAETEAKKKAEKLEAKLKSEQEAKLEKESRIKAEKEAKADLEAIMQAEKEAAKLKAEQDLKWKAEQQEFLQLKQADLEAKLNAEKEAAKMLAIEQKTKLLTEKETEAIQVQKLAKFQKSPHQEYDESSKEIKPTFVQLSSRDEITDQDAVESFHHEVENLEWERQLLQEMEQENNDDFEQYFSHPVINGSSSHKEPTKEAFNEVMFQHEKETPLTEKERKKEEKRLKAEREKVEKERKKQEKLRQKEEEKELKKQKEAKKQAEKEAEKEAKKEAEKAKKEAAKAKKEAEKAKKESKVSEMNVDKVTNGVTEEEHKIDEADGNATHEAFENNQEWYSSF